MLLNPYLATTGVGTGGGGPTYLLEERFEGTGYQYAGGWTETGTGTIDENFDTTGLSMEGSQCLRIAASAQGPRTRAVFTSDQTEVWLFWKMRIVVGLSVNRAVVALVASDTTTTLTSCTLNTNNTLAATTFTSLTSTTDALTTGTTYNVWMHCIKGSGSNGFCSVGFSTGTTEVTAGTAYAQRTTGVNTLDFNLIQLAVTNLTGTSTTGEVIFDQLLISNTGTIGDNPA